MPLPLPCCCPRTGLVLRPATAPELEAAEALRRAGRLTWETTAPQYDPGEPLEGLLIREDGAVGYGIVGGIPVLLPDHGFRLVLTDS